MSEHQEPRSKASTEVPLDHEYDGITEYDNPLPRWWVWIFWLTFFFAIGYFFHFQLTGNGKNRMAEFEDDVRIANDVAMKAASKEQVSEDSLAKLLENAASQAAGAAIFAARCQSCHAEQGKGLIGPNLTDAYWLHGSGKLMDIFETVSNGVLAKGMPAWSKQLSPMELRNVVSYVASLRGKNLPGKEPQGEIAGSAKPVASAGPSAVAGPQDSAAPAGSIQRLLPAIPSGALAPSKPGIGASPVSASAMPRPPATLPAAPGPSAKAPAAVPSL